MQLVYMHTSIHLLGSSYIATHARAHIHTHTHTEIKHTEDCMHDGGIHNNKMVAKCMHVH